MRKKTSFSVLFLSLLSPVASAATLAEAYRAALTKSEVVKQASERIVEATEANAQIRGGLFPQLSFHANHQIQDDPPPAYSAFTPTSQTNAGFGLSQALFRGFGEWATLRKNRHLHQAAEANKTNAQIQLFHELAQNYLGILSSEQDLRNLDEQLRIYQDRIKELRARVRRGESNETEAVSAEATHNALLAEIQLGKGGLQTARENFSFLTGMPANTGLVDPDSLGTSKRRLAPIEDYLKRIEERPDIRAAQEKFAADDEDVSVASAGHWPQLDLRANYWIKRAAIMQDIDWDVMLELKFPLFAGGSTQAGVRKAIASRNVSDLELQRLRRKAGQEIRSYYDQVKTRLDYIERQSKSVDLARQSTKLLQRDYRRGLVRNLDIQIALSELRVAQRNFDSARFAAQLDFYKLQSAAALAPLESKETTP